MGAEELANVLNRAGTLCLWVSDKPPICAAIAFLLNRLERNQPPTAGEFADQLQAAFDSQQHGES